MTMIIGLSSRTELAGFARPAWFGGGSARPDSATRYFRLAWLLAAVFAVAGWLLLSGSASKKAEIGQPSRLATAVVAEPPSPAPALAVLAFSPPTAEGEAIVPEEAAPVDGLKISSQYWRRGGLGSNALVTLTLRNRNDYAVRDIEISCAFSRRNGSHLTDRTRIIPGTVNMRSRKTFTRMHVGFVNINASKAKCSPVAARHI